MSCKGLKNSPNAEVVGVHISAVYKSVHSFREVLRRFMEVWGSRF